MKKIALLIALVTTGLFATAQLAQAGKFSPVILVNDGIITEYEMDQRKLMLQAFNSSGNLEKIATEQLIEERLQLQAARSLNITVSPDQIEEGMTEFASRANLDLNQILQYLNSRGIARESYRDFVRAGLIWREVVRARFGRQAQVTEEELDTTLSLTQGNRVQEVLISEIVIPTAERGPEGATELAERLSKSLKSQASFSAAARKYSRSPSARRGGKVDWIPAGNLPAPILTRLLSLEKNEVTEPIDLSGAVAIFQLRNTRSGQATGLAEIVLGYAEVKIPASVGDEKTQIANARALISISDTCIDLQATSQKFGKSAFSEEGGEKSSLSDQVVMELAKLDPNEASYYRKSNDELTVIMLCSRTRELPEGEREELRNSLFNQKISGLGDGYLQELRGDAIITFK